MRLAVCSESRFAFVFMFWVGMTSTFCVFGGCGSAASSVAVDRRAIEVWERHEVVVERAIKGRQENDDFIEACLFFGRITGISIHVDMFTLGFLPEPEAARDLELIRAWYRENSFRLYWDEESKTVRVRDQ